MDNLLKNVPGFRSGKKKNKMIAVAYYGVSVLSVIFSLSVTLFMLAMPVLVFGAIDLVTYKKKQIPFKEAIRLLTIGMALVVVAYIVQPANYPEVVAAPVEEEPAIEQTAAEPELTEPLAEPESLERLHPDTLALLSDPNSYPSDFLLVLNVVSKAWETLELDAETFETLRANTLVDQAVRDLLAFREDSSELPAVLHMSVQRFIAVDPQYETVVSSYFDDKDYFEVRREFREGNWILVITSTIDKETVPEPFIVSLD